MIISIECQHQVRMRWSRGEKGYVPIGKDHASAGDPCVPAWSVVDGVRNRVGKRPEMAVEPLTAALDTRVTPVKLHVVREA